jgi:hypothetical protein
MNGDRNECRVMDQSYANRVMPGQRIEFIALNPTGATDSFIPSDDPKYPGDGTYTVRLVPGQRYSGVVEYESNGGYRGIEMTVVCDDGHKYNGQSTGTIITDD